MSELERSKTTESYYRMIPQFTLAVGMYTNSYRHHIGPELAGDGWGYRLSRDQVDDTCFSVGKTFYSLEDAIRGIMLGIEAGDYKLAVNTCEGLLHGLNMDWKEIDEASDRFTDILFDIERCFCTSPKFLLEKEDENESETEPEKRQQIFLPIQGLVFQREDLT